MSAPFPVATIERMAPAPSTRPTAAAPTTTSATSDHDSSYVIAGGRPGRERLRVLAGVLASPTLALLGRVGIPHDARILDLGCGGGDVTRLLGRLAPQGTVIGVDFDADVVAIAAEETGDALDNVEYVVGDVTDPTAHTARMLDERGPFDVVYARFLLSHLADPAAMLRRMAQWCVGGVVIVEDIDLAGAICSPPHDSFTRSCQLYAETVRARGGNPTIGIHLPVMLDAAGLSDVEVAIAQAGGLRGDGKRVQLLTLETIAPTAIRLGLTTASEVERLTEALRIHLDRTDTFLTTARVIQTWGCSGARP